MDVIKYFLSSQRPPAAVAGAGGGKGAQLPLRHILGISSVDPYSNQPASLDVSTRTLAAYGCIIDYMSSKLCTEILSLSLL